jgi:hypothetical protein
LEELEADDIELFRNFYHIHDANHINNLTEFQKNCEKIYKKISYSILRLIFLFLFFYLDNFYIGEYLKNLIDFLLIHESLVITNFLILKGYLFYENYLNFYNFNFNVNVNLNHNNNNNSISIFPNICKYLNSINNL